jgi:hypothetical protein
MARRAGGRRWNNAVQARSLTDRLCLAHRSSRVATRALHVAVVVWSVLFFWPAPGAAEPPSTIGVELNRLEDQGGSCRAYLVIANPGSDEFTGFALDLVVFDRGGTIMRRLAVNASPLRPAKTSVKVFDIAETACSAIGSILVNDVIHCRDKTGDVAGCVDRLTTSSKLAISLLK